jgi:predicted nucleic acid-binding protein
MSNRAMTMIDFLPDSNVYIQFGRGNVAATNWFQAALNAGQGVGICPVIMAECLTGAKLAERAGWDEIFEAVAFWTIEPADAKQSGIYRYDFARRGIQLGLGDTLIAAVAKRVGATVVTNSVKDFPMTDVRVQAFP